MKLRQVILCGIVTALAVACCPCRHLTTSTQDSVRVETVVRTEYIPDTVFVKAMGGLYDVVVAMYHDQGHIPLKLSGFRMDPKTGLFTSMSGVNTTVGLPILRTSVDHGTAFDRAGKNTANEESMVDAIEMAVTMAKHKFAL